MEKRKIRVSLLVLVCLNCFYWGALAVFPFSLGTDLTKCGIVVFVAIPLLVSFLIRKTIDDKKTVTLKVRTTNRKYLFYAALLAFFAVAIDFGVLLALEPEIVSSGLENAICWNKETDIKDIAMYLEFLPVIIFPALVFLLVPFSLGYLIVAGWYRDFFPMLEKSYGNKKAGVLLGFIMGLQYFTIVKVPYFYSGGRLDIIWLDLLGILGFFISLSVCLSFFITKTGSLLPSVLLCGTVITSEFVLSMVTPSNEKLVCEIIPKEFFRMLGVVSVSIPLFISKRLWLKENSDV